MIGDSVIGVIGDVVVGVVVGRTEKRVLRDDPLGIGCGLHD